LFVLDILYLHHLREEMFLKLQKVNHRLGLRWCRLAKDIVSEEPGQDVLRGVSGLQLCYHSVFEDVINADFARAAEIKSRICRLRVFIDFRHLRSYNLFHNLQEMFLAQLLFVHRDVTVEEFRRKLGHIFSLESATQFRG